MTTAENKEIALCLINESDFYDLTRRDRNWLISRIKQEIYTEDLAIRVISPYVAHYLQTSRFMRLYYTVYPKMADIREITEIIITHWLDDYLIETPQPPPNQVRARLRKRVIDLRSIH